MIVSILFLVTGLLLIFFVVNRLRKGQASQAHARRTRRHHEPRLDLNSQQSSSPDSDHHNDFDDALGLKQTSAQAASSPSSAPNKKKKPPQYVLLYAMAEAQHNYRGYELLQTLLANDLTLGNQQLFEYKTQYENKAVVLFSVASIVKPGTFDLSAMGAMQIPGLLMFMMLKPHKDNMQAFEAMLSTARNLVDDLGGALLDEKHQTLTTSAINRTRKRIEQYEQTQLMPDLFDGLE